MRFARSRDRLLLEHGPQGWWPADTPFEIMVGALLVQRTTWRNAERAIAALKRAGLLDPRKLASADLATLQDYVRPAGFYRTKSGRVRALARFVLAAGGVAGLVRQPTDSLRRMLLDQPGIGAETADAILLYVFGRPVVVVDAYLRRFAARLEASNPPPTDADIVRAVTGEIDSADELSEFHALVVAHGKRHCRKIPRCDRCAVSSLCRSAQP